MILNIKGRFNLSKLWSTPYKNEFCENELSKIKIRSFNGINKVFISHLDIPDIELQFPINTFLDLDLNNIEDEIKRFSTFYDCKIFTNTKYKKKKLIIYHNNPMLIGLLDYIISLSNYSEYHIFSSSNESYNTMNYLVKKYKQVRLNDIEENINSMFRLYRNDYDDIYNDDDKYYHKIVFFSKDNDLFEIGLSIKWLSNFYISMPYNKALIMLLQHYFKNFINIKLISVSNGYCIIYISSISNRKNNITTEDILNYISKMWKKYRKNIHPMKYKK